MFILVIVIGGFIVAGSSYKNQATSRWWPAVNAAQDQSPLIKVIQRMLISHHRPNTHTSYNLGSTGTDGLAGPATQQAVQDFQRDNHLNPTGIVDSSTWGKLIIPSREGDYGEYVASLQEMLNTYAS